MKFKYIVLIFNILIVFFLLAVCLMPSLMMGQDFTAHFWRASWPLPLALLFALAALNVFFLANRSLFRLLEREDWPALIEYLERTMLQKGRYSPRRVRLLANACLVMGDSAGVLRLENKLAIAKPALLEANALIFGTARVLGGDPRSAVEFFQTRLKKGSAKEKEWIRLFYGFSLMLSGQFGQAEKEYKALSASSSNALITGLSSYFLHEILACRSAVPVECSAIAEAGRDRVKAALKNAGGWKKEAAKIETEVHAAVIKKYLDEAGLWLFG